MFETFSKSAASFGQHLRVRSALNPMLWLTGIGSPICIGAAAVFRDTPITSSILLTVGLLPVLVACGGFVYFAIRKPEMLRSEGYQLRHQALLIIQQKSGTLELDPASLNAIANPALTALPAGDEDES